MRSIMAAALLLAIVKSECMVKRNRRMKLNDDQQAHRILAWGNFRACNIYINNGGDANNQSQLTGNTFLHLFIGHPHFTVEQAMFLVEHGARLDIKNREGECCLASAMRYMGESPADVTISVKNNMYHCNRKVFFYLHSVAVAQELEKLHSVAVAQELEKLILAQEINGDADGL